MDDYKDIIDLPHPEPKNHPRMAPGKRAAQFMPFAALSGMMEMYDDVRRQHDKDSITTVEEEL